ncbi:MAG: transglutaminase-like domain-containing protein [Propioniciclava sp.]
MTTETGSHPQPRWLLDLGMTAALLSAALIGFWPTFDGPSFLVAAAGGLLLGLTVATLCAWRGWGTLKVAGLTIAAYFLGGSALALPQTAIARVIPTLETLRMLAVGTVTSWKQLLTSVAPVSAADGHLLVPFLVALLAAVLAGSCALRLTRIAWALLPVLGAWMLVIALGVPDPAFPIVQGVALALLTVVWLSLHSWWAPGNSVVDLTASGPAHTARARTRRLLAGVLVVALAASAGVGLHSLSTATGPRQIFRDRIVPPFNVREIPSPLQSFRRIVRDQEKSTLFTVSGLPQSTRVRLAAMDAWDGVVYNLTDGGPTSSSAFMSVRTGMAAEALGVPTPVTFEIHDYTGLAVPGVTATDSITFAGPRAEELRRQSYHNPGTGTTITTARLRQGDSYTLNAILPAEISDEQLAEAPFGQVSLPSPSNVPGDLAAVAADLLVASEAETDIGRIRALEAYFAQEGRFSHGLKGEALSRAGHTAERLATLLGGNQMVGDDEQYAVAMALAARELGIPARVVMGFYPSDEQTGAQVLSTTDEDASADDQTGNQVFAATGNDLHAWVEVNFEGFGWVPFNPTPPENRLPNDQNTKPRVDPKPQVLQPPPPPQEPVDLPPTVPDEREAEEDAPKIWDWVGLILAIAGISGATLALLASPFIVIGAWKAAKRRSRRLAARASDRITGGWDELTDRAVDYGVRLPPGGTRTEEAATVAGVLSLPTVTSLAARADGQVFGPAEPSPDDVDAFWHDIDAAVGGMSTQSTSARRLRARLSLRSLLGSGRLATRVQALKAAAVARRSAHEDPPVPPASETQP